MASCYSSSHATAYRHHRGVQSGVLRALLDLLASARPRRRVLEIGCGTANHLRALAEAVDCEGWGIDPSAPMLTQGRDLPCALRLIRAQAEALPFDEACFDLAFSVDVVHHIGDLAAALGEAARVLRPGGLLLTATDSEETIRSREVLSGCFPETVPHELARYPTVDRLMALHQESGLEILNAFVTEHPYVVEDSQPFRERAYSCLHLISDTALAAGIARLEGALPLETVSRNYVIIARTVIY